MQPTKKVQHNNLCVCAFVLTFTRSHSDVDLESGQSILLTYFICIKHFKGIVKYVFFSVSCFCCIVVFLIVTSALFYFYPKFFFIYSAIVCYSKNVTRWWFCVHIYLFSWLEVHHPIDLHNHQVNNLSFNNTRSNHFERNPILLKCLFNHAYQHLWKQTPSTTYKNENKSRKQIHVVTKIFLNFFSTLLVRYLQKICVQWPHLLCHWKKTLSNVIYL